MTASQASEQQKKILVKLRHDVVPLLCAGKGNRGSGRNRLEEAKVCKVAEENREEKLLQR